MKLYDLDSKSSAILIDFIGLLHSSRATFSVIEYSLDYCMIHLKVKNNNAINSIFFTL